MSASSLDVVARSDRAARVAAAPHPCGTPATQPVTLFAPRVILPSEPAQPKAKVLSGTLFLEADLRVDPKMAQEPRKDAKLPSRTIGDRAAGRVSNWRHRLRPAW